ncbi:MAG: chorismate-binding protein, partial [Alphaproteobacteria bacterium]|nr:chorismate-binding protein [Alphaproteobacteria bacterium]
MSVSPDYQAFAPTYEAGRPQAVWTNFVADLETPVSTMLKLAEGRANSCLLESVEGGAVRGRYSIIGLKPDLIWRCFGARAEFNSSARYDPDAFEPCAEGALESMRRLIRDSRIELPETLPPMAAGLIGYIGYDMVRHMERLPEPNPDALHLPDAILMRPTIMAIFDSVEDVVTLVTPVWPEEGLNARAAYGRAAERLADTVADLERPLPVRFESAEAGTPEPVPTSNTSEAEYHRFVERAKEYIAAGDIFQVVPSQRFSAPFALPPFSLYRALRRLNPSP